MITSIGRFLVAAIVLALALGVVTLAPTIIAQALLACAGLALAYFGGELAPMVGLGSIAGTSSYVDPLVRGIGWILLLATVGLFLARVTGVW